MTPPPLPYVRMVSNGKGRTYWRFRTKETGDLGLPGQPDSPEFHRAYAAALEQRDKIRAGDRQQQDEDGFAWLADRYQESAEFKALATPTQLDYSKTCALLKDELGDQPWRYITRAMLKAVRDDYAATTRKANKVTQMARRIYSWGNEADLVPDGCNPAVGLKKLKRKGGDKEIIPWSDQEIAWVVADAPLHVQTPILLALYTGQRREDVASMTWQQDQGDLLRVRTSKTRALIDLPCHPALRAHLDQVRRGAKVVSLTGTICLSPAGKPYSVNAMSGAVRRQVEKQPRVPNNRSMHGLRYAAAARMEEGGATVAAIEAVLGHRTFKMALKYATARARAREGVEAMKGGSSG